MLISPPFTPVAVANELDQDYLSRAMIGGEPGNGAFPVSHDMGWHGGIHLKAPQVGSAHISVRSIADGVVAYFRQPEPKTNELDHPLNYRGGWTDSGCIVIRHETEVGEGTQAKVVFYSIYMHLSSITLVDIYQGLRVYRKDELGVAGSIYGADHKIHFEIVSSQENVSRLIGRASEKLSILENGRTDSHWGDTHFHLPPEAIFYSEPPSDLRSSLNTSAIIHRPTEAYFVKMTYDQGQCTVTTYDETGQVKGERRETQDYEYKLYKTASTIYPDCPSAGYELLRFGKVFGPDQLQPTDSAHWRQVAYSDGIGWVNLNGPTVTFYSDADFPHWTGWRLVDDDANGDGRCQSNIVMDLLGITETPSTQEQRDSCNSIVTRPENQEKLKKLIFKFPSEWKKSDFNGRYGWLTEGSSPIIAEESYQKLKLHYEKLAFWEDAALEGIESEHWHFHPRSFIEAFRKCAWFSLEELAYTLPKYHDYRQVGANWVATTTGNPNLYQISHASAMARLNSYYVSLNKVMMKYGITTISRRTHFLAQVLLETGRWRTVEEIGKGYPHPSLPMAQYYAAFYGRGIMQMTWAGTYEKYGNYRSARSLPAMPNGGYADPRVTPSSTHYWKDPTLRNASNQIVGVVGVPQRWAPRYDPNLIESDPYNACDSGGFFWVSTFINQSGSMNMNRHCDKPFTPVIVGAVSSVVNGGTNGYHERQAFAQYIFRFLSESNDTSLTMNLNTPRQHVIVQFAMSRPS
ncbi:hydroxyethylthiazole kinase [Pseudomonas sp. Seg1]|uniref:hypothetical protein n=1 Tax=Pseudomonas sp. Seg1 TaxID=2678259 RepID=UPI001BB43509|nr:hypothetical protein [Pseudomonas sp. Seg1]BBP73727.1 hydroxyethylthiazole kinase [Pseudomonas sp. Seg1]